MGAMIELYLWAAFALVLAVWAVISSRIFSAMVLAVLFVVLVYLVVAATLGGDIRVTTMRWPESHEHIGELARIAGLWVLIFSAVSFLGSRLVLRRRKRSLRPWAGLGNFQLSKRHYIRIWYWSLAVGLGLFLLTAEGWWIFRPYPESKGIWRVIDLGGLQFVATLSLLAGLHAGLASGTRYRILAIGLFFLVSAHHILSGDRGSLLFWLMGGLTLFYLGANESGRRRLAVASLMAVIPLVWLLNEISTWRSWGLSSADRTFAGIVEDIDLLPQALAHLSHAYNVVEVYGTLYAGSLVGFVLKLFVQILPSDVLRPLGWNFYSGPWELAEFVRHGGGFFVPAESYFVGGYMGIFVLGTYLGVLAIINDRLLATGLRGGAREIGRPAVLAAILATGSLPYTMFYGLQSLNRMATLPLIILTLISVYRLLSGKRKSGVHVDTH